MTTAAASARDHGPGGSARADRAAGTGWWRESWRSALIATAVALFGGVAVGAATPLLQGALPAAVNSFANSAGGWTALAFLLVWAGRARPLLAAPLGAVAFVAMVESYGAVSASLGAFYSAPFTDLFTFVGMAAGPVLGVAASAARWAPVPLRPLGVAVLSAVLVGEGVYGLVVVAATTSPVYWSIQLAAGVLVLVAALGIRPARRSVFAAVGLAALGAATFYWL
ncbi:DUF6518 family protein [Herbiconiux sp. SYSU D00978]|uniref:DUF6518 family protein n=1 Tax=Herbiconiux sp. SYSU D00978 TaxID=2812562 RepID=UPI001A965A0D|nr:DUF6518 family protein [Herbiconiux sp. SYSU D00978]